MLLAGLFAAACTRLDSPDVRARKAVEAASAEGISLPVGEAVLEVPPGRLSATSVSTAPLGEGRLRGFARISLEGRIDGIPVSYLGDERFEVICAASCALEGSPARRLTALLEVLRARRAALEAGDRQRLIELAVPDARPQLTRADLGASAARPAVGWFIRIDRDQALVGEALAQGGQRQLVLRGEEGTWRFVSGLP